MRNRWSKLTALAGLLVACSLVVPGASAQNKNKKVQKMVVTKATKSRGMGQDPNIKQKSDVNDPNRPAPRPAEK